MTVQAHSVLWLLLLSASATANWDLDNINLDVDSGPLYRGDSICATPDDGGGYFCFELNSDGAIRIKTYRGKGGSPIATLLDTKSQFGIDGGDYVYFSQVDEGCSGVSGTVGLFKNGKTCSTDALYLLAQDGSSGGYTLIMRKNGNLQTTYDFQAYTAYEFFEDSRRLRQDCAGDAYGIIPCGSDPNWPSDPDEDCAKLCKDGPVITCQDNVCVGKD